MKFKQALTKKIFFCLSIGILFLFSSTKGQTPTKCLEIESILVDACGSPEGENEMVRFKVGTASINISDLDITWPNNFYLGISPANSITAAIVSTLNASIQGCGRLVEPSGGVLPAGKNILLITSTAMITTANSFANLMDTLYIIFQNSGNTAGHFANSNTAPGLRTLIIKQTSTNCSDTVTYDRTLLVNQSGGYGGSAAQNDGATVRFSWLGSPVYLNNGCQAPFTAITSNPGTGNTICEGTTVNLNGIVTGNYSGIIWQAASGTFSNPLSVSTTYTPSVSSGIVTILFGAITSCQDTIFSSLNLTIISPPLPLITPSSTTLCSGETETLTASGGTSYLWSTGATTNSIIINNQGTYWVTSGNSCGTDTATTSILTDSVNALFTSNVITGVYPLTVDFTNASSLNAITYSWSFDDGNSSSSYSPSNTFQSSGIYNVSLTVTNTSGCINSYSIPITVIENPSALWIPNTFSPNGDGLNDVYNISGVEISEFKCTIFDRWGILVAELNDLNESWDGKKKGTLVPGGVYVFILKAKGKDDKSYELTGTIFQDR